jgi:hypothetical protein
MGAGGRGRGGPPPGGPHPGNPPPGGPPPGNPPAGVLLLGCLHREVVVLLQRGYFDLIGTYKLGAPCLVGLVYLVGWLCIGLHCLLWSCVLFLG